MGKASTKLQCLAIPTGVGSGGARAPDPQAPACGQLLVDKKKQNKTKQKNKQKKTSLLCTLSSSPSTIPSSIYLEAFRDIRTKEQILKYKKI